LRGNHRSLFAKCVRNPARMGDFFWENHGPLFAAGSRKPGMKKALRGNPRSLFVAGARKPDRKKDLWGNPRSLFAEGARNPDRMGNLRGNYG
jgi:hypothetical protein